MLVWYPHMVSWTGVAGVIPWFDLLMDDLIVAFNLLICRVLLLCYLHLDTSLSQYLRLPFVYLYSLSEPWY